MTFHIAVIIQIENKLMQSRNSMFCKLRIPAICAIRYKLIVGISRRYIISVTS